MRSVRRVFQVDGYEGDYSVTVPDGVQKGGMFQFDGDLKRCATASRLSRDLQAEDLDVQVARRRAAQGRQLVPGAGQRDDGRRRVDAGRDQGVLEAAQLVLRAPADIAVCCSQAGKEMKKLKQNADVAKKGHKMAKDLGINISPKQAMDLAKAGSKLKK